MKHLIGQRMAIGFSGTAMTKEFMHLVRKYKIGNVILFKENLENRNQAAKLCSDIRQFILEETGFPPFIAIDQEGGVVTRLPQDMINVPGAMALAASGDKQAVYEANLLTVGELREIGVNFNLAPVLDVNSNPQNPVIGVRSYGATAKRVADYALPGIKAYENTGVYCCAKHFPGHGDTAVDSHLALPMIDRSLEELKKVELATFQGAIDKNIPAIMTTHILFPQVEPLRLPATMSRKIMTDLLKKEMGFKGLVLSDGMEMNAIKEEYGTPQGCVKALEAGVDIVFVCHDPKLMEDSINAVFAAFDRGEYDIDEFDASIHKIKEYKEKSDHAFRQPYPFPIPSLPRAKAQNAALMKKTITLAGKPISSLGDKPLFFGCLPYRSTIASAPADTALSFANWFAAAFNGKGQNTPLDPSEEEIDKIIEKNGKRKVTSYTIGTYNAHLNPGQLMLANKLIALAKEKEIPTTVIALRNPYDLQHISDDASKIAAFEYTLNSFAALEEVLKMDYIPQGKLDFDLSFIPPQE